MLSPSDRATLTNVQTLVRSLGDTPLADNLDALVSRLDDGFIFVPMVQRRADIATGTSAMRVTGG